MRNTMLAVTLFLALIVLTACSGKGGEKEIQGSAAASQAETPADETVVLSGDEVNASDALPTEQAAEAAVETAKNQQMEKDRPIDVDLSTISGTVVYSQVYDMMMQPETYLGQRIRMKGAFSYYQDPDTKQEYFAVVIADATACCAQGIEFVWEGEHTYPQDYPPLETEITVTGTFGTYEENGYSYLQLTDAEIA